MTGAKPSVGSSSRSRRAPVRRMRAIASICCSPPESFVPWLLSRSLRLGKSSKMRASGNPPSRTSGGKSRFSSTFRAAKMPRSSGQKAIPSRAMRLEGKAIVSRPAKVTEPVRRATMPMIDFIVVVFPAPLRPRSVTTSPGITSKSTPWRMCDSPYQALRPLTARSGAVVGIASGRFRAAALLSRMARAHIGLDHIRVARDLLVVAFGEDLAARQHRDDMGEVGDDAEIVLDHQHRAIGGGLLDECGDAIDILVPHPRGGLVEQHHLRIKGQSRSNFEGALAPIGQLDRRHMGEVR